MALIILLPRATVFRFSCGRFPLTGRLEMGPPCLPRHGHRDGGRDRGRDRDRHEAVLTGCSPWCGRSGRGQPVSPPPHGSGFECRPLPVLCSSIRTKERWEPWLWTEGCQGRSGPPGARCRANTRASGGRAAADGMKPNGMSEEERLF